MQRGAIVGMVCAGLLGSAQADPVPNVLPRAASVSVCTDQFLLSLANPEQVAAVSWQAGSVRSPVRDLVRDYPVIRGSAEEMLAVEADIVIFDPYGHPHTSVRLEELGTQVVRLGPISGTADVEDEIQRIADVLGVGQRGTELADELQQRRERLQARSDHLGYHPRALYVVPGGGGAGADTFIDEIIRLAGFDNLQAELGRVGWGPVPLEQLVETPPDVIIMSFFETSDPSLLDSFGRHPHFRELLATTPIITVPAETWLCAGPYLLDAAEYIAAERLRLFPVEVMGDGS